MSAAKKQSEELAAFLRSDEAHGLDDLHRARLERQFLSAARERSVDAGILQPVSLAPPKAKRTGVRWAGGAVAVLAAAALGWLALRPTEEAPRYAVRTDDTGGEVEGPIEPGTELALAAGEAASVELFDLAVNVSERSRLRVEAVSLRDVRLALSEGDARFAFHPRDRGHQSVTIRTPSARIEIVGTELTVRVGPEGTEVTVHEGVVRVIPTVGEVQLVRAGDSITVPVAVAALAPGAVRAGGEGSPENVLGMDEGTPAAGDLGAGHAEGAAPTDATEGHATESRAEDSEAEPRSELDADRARLRRAVALLDQRQRAAADAIFEDLAEHASSRSVRADAWTYLGVSHALGGDRAAARAAYEHAVALSVGEDRDNALYELTRMADPEGAQAAWARYLAEYPRGNHAASARRHLCDLGSTDVPCP